MPSTANRFDAYIADGINVWTKKESKMAAIQATLQMLFDGRLAFAEPVAVADKTAFIKSGRSQPTDPETIIRLAADQLPALRDQDDGSVTGKTLAGDNDDLAIAHYGRLLVHELRSVRN